MLHVSLRGELAVNGDVDRAIFVVHLVYQDNMRSKKETMLKRIRYSKKKAMSLPMRSKSKKNRSTESR